MLLHDTNIKVSITYSSKGKVRHVLTFPHDIFVIKQEVFESLGFKFENIKDGSPHKVVLPTGWQFDSMPKNELFYILDEKKRCRAVLTMYSAAGIAISLICRFGLKDKFIDEETGTGVYVVDSDGTEIYLAGYYSTYGSHMQKRCDRKANNYLSEHFPDWKNPTKYWN